MKQSINVNGAPAAVGPYVHAVKTGNMIFISGQLGLNPADGTLPEGIEAQTIQSLENVKTILEGTKYFANEVPARSCVEVANLPKAALVEIEAIAVEK